jgi:hypothetical protein
MTTDGVRTKDCILVIETHMTERGSTRYSTVQVGRGGRKRPREYQSVRTGDPPAMPLEHRMSDPTKTHFYAGRHLSLSKPRIFVVNILVGQSSCGNENTSFKSEITEKEFSDIRICIS